MSFDFDYLVSFNPSSVYAGQYSSTLLNEMQKKIDRMQAEASMDDFERGYRALLQGDTNKAIRLWEKEAQVGVIEAHLALGDLYLHKLENLQKSIFHFEKAYQSGETKAGALVLFAKLRLGRLNKDEIDSVSQDIKDEPWFKFVKASYMVMDNNYLDFFGDDKGEEIRDLAIEAVEGGVLPAGTLISRFIWIEFLFGMYAFGRNILDAEDEKNSLNLVELCADKGEAAAAELLLFWKLFSRNTSEPIQVIGNFEQKFEWPEKKNYEVFGIAKAILLLPLREKSRSKKFLSATKMVTSALGSDALDSLSTDWERFETFKLSLQPRQKDSELIQYVMNTIDKFGVVEAKRVLALRFIELAFDPDSSPFGVGFDNELLGMYYFLALSQICVEGWQTAADKNLADVEYLSCMPILRDFNAAYFPFGEEDSFHKWEKGPLNLESKVAIDFYKNWMPILSEWHSQLVETREKAKKSQ